MDALLEQFLQEARENLAFIDQNIEDIGGDDPELLNSVFRAAHTLKGGSGIVGFESVKNITHHAEDLLDMLRAGKIDFDPAMVEVLYDAFDEVLNLVEAAEESEEIVDADEDRVNEIVGLLSAQMGKGDEVEVWSAPFDTGVDSSYVINMPMPYLKTMQQNLVYQLGEINQDIISAPQLYAVVFDIDESCMVYGNDPIYTLSLLGEKVLHIHTCMGETSAKSVLSGLDDPDGLLLATEITAFIYTTYEDISDVLFNFLDELQFIPLDVEKLLNITVGEENHQLDVLKELSQSAAAHLKSTDIESLSNELEKTIGMIGSDTIQASQLQRVSDVINVMDSSDYTFLLKLFNSLPQGIVFSKMEEVSSVETEEETSSTVIEVDEHIRTSIDEILLQQKRSLEINEDEKNVTRVAAILEKIRPYYNSMPSALDSKENIVSWIASVLNGSEELNEVVEIPKAEVEIEPKIEEKVVVEKVTVAPKIKIETPVKKVEVISKAAEIPDTTVDEVVKVEVVKDAKETPKTASKEPAKKPVIGKTVKIEQESIDSLMNIIGELLVAKNSLPYLADTVADMNTDMIKRAIMEKYTFINRLSEQLQDLIMGMRMLPISYVFDRYPKLVRDISKNMGKKVKLNMEGGETKLDKNMIEMLADPMIHIMRNSLDHGVEMPDVREQKGKNAEGTVNLRAFAQSDKIIIEIIDDGAGINVDKVINKVLEKGLLTHEQIDAMGDNERAELVLLPGLSTADEITEYSGRGVGMDVVKKSIEGFGGKISITTKANQGTVITLAIPVSLAVSTLLHVSMDAIHYGFPMDNVAETVKIEKSEIEYLHSEPFVYIRGEVIPLLFIESMLDASALENKPLSIVVLNIKDNLVAVVVNELLGQLDVVQKPLEGLMENHPLFSGTALLGNGQIIMAIDPLGLLSIAHEIKSLIEQAS